MPFFVFLSTFLCVNAVAVVAATAAQPDVAELKRLSQSLVKVEAIDDDERLWLGTGVTVAPERIVTNCHVTRRAQTIRAYYRGRGFTATTQSADTEHDICILSVPALNAQPAQLGSSQRLHEGEPVWALGHERGLSLQMRGGVVRALHSYDGSQVVETTTAFTSGASGGALFNEIGELVGILTYRLRGDSRSYFAIPVEWFRAQLANHGTYRNVAPLDGTLAFWERPSAQLPFFLRAHQLETGGDWNGLIDLAEEWSQADISSAEAWLFRGKGLAERRDLASARQALQRAVALDPVYSAAWLQLGRLSAHQGAHEEAKDALATLILLNRALARCLAIEMHISSPDPAPYDPSFDACPAI